MEFPDKPRIALGVVIPGQERLDDYIMEMDAPDPLTVESLETTAVFLAKEVGILLRMAGVIPPPDPNKRAPEDQPFASDFQDKE